MRKMQWVHCQMMRAKPKITSASPNGSCPTDVLGEQYIADLNRSCPTDVLGEQYTAGPNGSCLTDMGAVSQTY